MNTSPRLTVLFLAVLCLATPGCSTTKKLAKTLTAMGALREEIIKNFGDADVDVNLFTSNDRSTLRIRFTNSSLNQKTSDERWDRATRTTQLVKEHYPEIKSINEIWIAFVRVTTRFVFFHWSEVIEICGFDRDGRALSEFRNLNTDRDPTKPVTNYSARQNRTDISGTVLLVGTPEKGLTMVPHFSLAGNIDKQTTKPPDEVSIDFASFSNRVTFPGVTKILFLNNGNVVFETEGQFSTSRSADGLVSEFLYLKVPARDFIKLTEGQYLSFNLGGIDYRLDDKEKLMLQRMSDYLKK